MVPDMTRRKCLVLTAVIVGTLLGGCATVRRHPLITALVAGAVIVYAADLAQHDSRPFRPIPRPRRK